MEYKDYPLSQFTPINPHIDQVLTQSPKTQDYSSSRFIYPVICLLTLVFLFVVGFKTLSLTKSPTDSSPTDSSPTDSPTFKQTSYAQLYYDASFNSYFLERLSGVFFVNLMGIANYLFLVIYWHIQPTILFEHFRNYYISSGGSGEAADNLIAVIPLVLIGLLEQCYTLAYAQYWAWMGIPYRSRIRMVMVARQLHGVVETGTHTRLIQDLFNQKRVFLGSIVLAIRLMWLFLHPYLGYLNVMEDAPKHRSFLIHGSLNLLLVLGLQLYINLYSSHV
jgi:hypothetical protein